jgi:1-aminocyclopropane-1-carboxylate deaminase
LSGLRVPLTFPAWQPVAPLQPLAFGWSRQAGVELAVLRLDLLDPLISGNKWFKLRGHLQQAAERAAEGLVSLGGAHSNHLHALAAAGQRFAFPTIGLLRGEPCITPTVTDLQAFGMQLHWLGYAGYRARHTPEFVQHWQASYPSWQLVPEGGGGLPGTFGFAAVVGMLQAQLPQIGWPDYHACWLAVGSGTSLAGLVLAEGGRHPVHGALVVPARYGVARQIGSLLQQAGLADQGYCLHPASRGGYARIDRTLAGFIQASEQASGMPLEGCYTGKALLALREKVEAGYFAAGARVVFVHTGGLQGRRAQQLPGLT